MHGRFSGDWATVISHKITGPNGEFLGVVTRAITPASFEKFFASLALGEGAAISMYHRDGTLLARYPHVEEMIGTNFKDGPVHLQVLSKTDHGTIRLTSPMDGMDRLASARALSEFPISVIATTTVAAALADWREQTRFLVVVASLSVIVIAGMLFLVVRKLSRQHRLEKQRLDTAVNNIPQGLVVYDNSAHVTVLQPPLHRDVRVVGAMASSRAARMQDLIAAPQGDRIVRWRRRSVLRRVDPRCRARQSHQPDHRGAGRPRDPDHQSAAGSRRLGCDDRRHHRTPRCRGADHPSRALRSP